MSTTQSLNIRPNQVEHLRKVLDILTKFYFYIDGSEMGSGKTYIGAAIAIFLKLPCLIFCPKGARETWRKVLLQYGINTYQITKNRGIITYETLRSTKGNQPKHGLLVRNDMGTHPTFYPTQLLTDLIRAGVLIIFDEAQKLKNDNDQHHAASAIMHHFYTAASENTGLATTSPMPYIRSRFALLSASLVDKPDHVINLMEMLGFIPSNRNSSINQFGVQDLVNKASQINSIGMSQFLMSAQAQIGSNTESLIQYIYQLFIHVIRPIVMSTIPRHMTNAIKDVRNGFYTLTPQELIVYNQAINRLSVALANKMRRKELRSALKMIHDPNDPNALIIQNNLINTQQNDLGDIINSLIMLQEAKMDAMIRITRQLLSLTPNYNGQPIIPKVILFADYYRVIDYLMQNLAEYNPLELTGRISESQRTRNINAFQQQDNQARLIIGNPIVGGLSISLNDITGYFPRFMFIMPNYRVNELHQATGRIFRDGTLGVAIIRFFYCRSDFKEKSILNALARKGEILKDVHIEQSEYGVKFPNEYPDEDESEFLTNFMNLFLASKVPTLPQSQLPQSQLPQSQLPQSQLPQSQLPQSQLPQSGLSALAAFI